jgi:putative ABC transport system permease protein
VPQAWLTVVGVVPDIWQNDMIRREFQPLIYLSFRQKPLPGMSLVARTAVPPATLGQAFRREVQAIDENLPVYALRTLDEDLELHDWGVRVFGAMFGIFAMMAMLLAAVGLYAVVAHSVNRRTQEIGVRLAMGATATNIVVSVFAQGMRQVALGLGIGLGMLACTIPARRAARVDPVVALRFE